MADLSNSSAAETAAYQQGHRRGLVIAALAVALVSFINLLNVEKSLLAIVLAVLAMRGAAKYESVHTWARLAFTIAIFQVIIVTTAVIVFHSTFLELLHFLQKIG